MLTKNVKDASLIKKETSKILKKKTSKATAKTKVPDWVIPARASMPYDSADKELKKQYLADFADLMIKVAHIKTMVDTKEMYYYDKGVYLPLGEEVVRKYALAVLGKNISKHAVDEIIAKIRPQTYTFRKSFMKHGYDICVENGILDTKTSGLRSHNPNELFLTKLPVKYDSNAKCPKIEKFVEEICGITINEERLYEVIGWILLPGYRIQRAAALVGGGANGKSTFIALIKALVGEDNYCSVSLHDLSESRFAKAELFGKMANLYADLSSRELKETGTLKILTGGDPITSEYKFRPLFTFTNEAKMVFSCNRLPRIKEDTVAWWRRWEYFDFAMQFLEDDPKTDPNILEKLTTPEELSGLLNKALEGAQRLLENGQFTHEEHEIDEKTGRTTIEKKREYYLARSEPVWNFIKDMLEITTNEKDIITKEILYQKFEIYCFNRRILLSVMPTQNQFGRRFKQLTKKEGVEDAVVRQSGKPCRAWKYVRFKTDTNTAQQKSGVTK